MINKDNISLILLICFCILHLIWLFALPLLPFVDLPFHLAEAEVFKNFKNPDTMYGNYFVIPSMIKSNSLYIYFCSLNIFPSVEFANKIFYGIYLIIFPLSVWSIIRTFGGNTFYALLSFVFLINHNVHWGFVSYMMSLPVIVFIYIIFYKYFIENNSKFAFFIWLLPILIFFLHFQMAIFTVLIIVILTFTYQRKSAMKILINSVSVIPVMVIMVYAYKVDSQNDTTSLFSYMLTYYSSSYFYSLLNRFNVLFVVDNYFILRGIPGLIFSMLATVPLAVFFLLKTLRIGFTGILHTSNLKFLFVIFIPTVLCFFILPDVIPGQNIIFERYSVPIFLLILIISSLYKTLSKRERTLNFIIPVIILIQTIFIFDYMFDFKNSTSDFNKDIFPDNNKARLAGVIIDNEYRGSKVYAHFPMYFTVWKQGIATGLIDYRFGLIKRNVSRDILPQYIEWTEKQINYDEYYKPVNFLIVKSNFIPKFNNFSFVKESGSWKLYKSNNDIK